MGVPNLLRKSSHYYSIAIIFLYIAIIFLYNQPTPHPHISHPHIQAILSENGVESEIENKSISLAKIFSYNQPTPHPRISHPHKQAILSEIGVESEIEYKSIFMAIILLYNHPTPHPHISHPLIQAILSEIELKAKPINQSVICETKTKSYNGDGGGIIYYPTLIPDHPRTHPPNHHETF